MELINEVKLGITKGTDLEKEVEMNFNGECKEVGLYLAMARLAQRKGYPEIAEALIRIAWDEAGHAARFAELNGIVSDDLLENLKMMLEGEIKANNEKKAAAKKAKELDLDEAHDVFDEASRDEARHAKILEGLIKRYFEN